MDWIFGFQLSSPTKIEILKSQLCKDLLRKNVTPNILIFRFTLITQKAKKNTAVASRLLSLSLDLHLQIVPGMMRVAN